ncbi:hypothetical protein ACES27_004533 [Salmonella enterica]|nr:hypothetical protein [Salmonella enterica]
MSEIKTYAVNCNDAWLNTEGDDISVSYVKYKDYQKVVAALEAKCAALAAENAAFKDINQWCKTDAFSNMYREFKTAEAVGCCNIDCMHDAMVVAIMHAPEAPATDAFLAEVRAQGVEMFADNLLCPDLDDTIRDFAAQLREGDNQK